MQVVSAHDFDSFRVAARALLAANRAPHLVRWQDGADPQPGLFDDPVVPAAPAGPTALHARVPRRYLESAQRAVLYRSADRFDLLYRLLYRLTQQTPQLLDDALDPDVRELGRRAQSVRDDEHRMHAFVRFRRCEQDGVDTFVAWYAPQHLVLRLSAPFFARRFAMQRWAILTPDESAFWDGAKLSYGAGVPEHEAPRGAEAEQQLEQLFRTYYRATYNPARKNAALFQRHVPRAFQRHMPELAELPSLWNMQVPQGSAAARPVPATSLQELREKLCDCTACALCEPATQVVPGEGPQRARLVLVGEQPGDEEDRTGRPFVGPAGQLLDRALVTANLTRSELYVTNAVKHFSFRPAGKKRLHQTPRWEHVSACRPWLQRELLLLQPALVVCLGATAAQALFGRRFNVGLNRGRVFCTPWASRVLVTYHPSAVLRAQPGAHAEQRWAELVADLKLAQTLLTAPPDAAAGS